MKQIVLDLQTPQIVEIDSIGLQLNPKHLLIGLEEPDGRRFIVKQNNYTGEKWIWVHPTEITQQNCKGDLMSDLKSFIRTRLIDGCKVYFWTASEHREYLLWLANEKS
jgi:hypothetical protein